jgi:hypothetical protein
VSVARGSSAGRVMHLAGARQAPRATIDGLQTLRVCEAISRYGTSLLRFSARASLTESAAGTVYL